MLGLAILCSGLLFYISLFACFSRLLVFISRVKLTEKTIHLVSLRLVSATQAVLACVAGSIIVISCSQDVLYDRHWLATGYTVFSTPYMYYDLWAMIKLNCLKHPETLRPGFANAVIQYAKKDKVMTFHHAVLPLFYFPLIVWFRRDIGDFFVGCFYMFELAIPFISIRVILRELGWNNSTFHILNGILLVVTYFTCRILIFPFMYYSYGKQYGYSWYQVPTHIPVKCTVGCLVLLSLQVYWQIQIFVTFYKALRRLFVKSEQMVHDSGSCKAKGF